MDAPRAPWDNLSDPSKRDILANNTERLWACYRRSMNRAQYLAQFYPRQAAKVKALDSAMFQTASIGGTGRADLRDALIGAKTPPVSLVAPVQAMPGRQSDGVPRL